MVTAESKARVSFVTVQVTSIHYLFHLFGNNPKERPLLLRTLAAPCRWETLGSFLDVSFYILSPFLLSRFFSIGIWRLHYFLRFVSLAKRKESLRTLAKQHDRGYRHLRDIGAAWRELRQTIYRPVKTRPYSFHPFGSVDRHAQSRRSNHHRFPYRSRVNVDSPMSTSTRQAATFRLLAMVARFSQRSPVTRLYFRIRIKRHNRQAETTQKRWSA